MNFASLRPGSTSPGLDFHTELSMSMGVSPASNIAQRFATALAKQAAADFDREEAPILAALRADPTTPAAVIEWLDARVALSARLGGRPC